MPVWLFGDDYSFGFQMGWLVFVIIILLVIVTVCNDNSANTVLSSNVYVNNNSELRNVNIHFGRPSRAALDKEFTERIRKVIRNREELENKLQKTKEELLKYEDCYEKPWYVSRKKYQEQVRDIVEKIKNDILMISEDITKECIFLNEYRTEEFEELEKMIHNLSKAAYISGIPAPRDMLVSFEPSEKVDYISWNVVPIIMFIGEYYILVFPHHILVFEDTGNFEAAYSVKAIRSVLVEVEEDKEWNGSNVHRDSKIITKEVLNTRRLYTDDEYPGYGNNPQIIYVQKKEKVIECDLTLTVVGFKLEYQISSFDISSALHTAVEKYRETKIPHNICKDIASLLSLCTSPSDENMSAINKILEERIATNSNVIN